VTLYLQTELCSETLEDYLNKRNAKLLKLKRQNHNSYLTEKRTFIKEAIFYAKQIISAVSHIHSKQIVHRDIKPGNIFLLGRTIKIGDFGLVKRLNSFRPLEASPIFEPFSDDGNLSDSFRLDSGPKKENGSLEEISYIGYQKALSDPISLINLDKNELFLDCEGEMTRSVGTKTFASPEQLSADKEKFDHRADIFSLGLVMLLLFHPMGTSMEQHKTIKDCKNRNLPSEMQKEMPEIASLIGKMMAENPNERPSLESISRQLSYPLITCSDLCGSVTIQRENSISWAKKHFKLIDKTLYIFEKEQDKKAEQVYDLSQWNIMLKELNLERKETGSDKENASPVISLEDPMQLGCAFRTESYLKTHELFEKFRRIGESF
jgi:serine/threonine protein kinase